MMLQTIFRYTSKIIPSSEDSLFYFHLIKRVQLFYIHFLPFWAANGSLDTSTGLAHEKRFSLHPLFQQTPLCVSHCSDLSIAGGSMGSTGEIQSCE